MYAIMRVKNNKIECLMLSIIYEFYSETKSKKYMQKELYIEAPRLSTMSIKSDDKIKI